MCRRPREIEEKHVKAQYQSISALGLKQVQSTCYMRSAVACQVQHFQYMWICMHYFLRSLGGVGRVQEGKKPAERATIARVAAANGGYVGTAASCRGIAR